jgi:hypothetical protein
VTNKRPGFPFTVFATAFRAPDGSNDPDRLQDPSASPDEKAEILKRLEADVRVVRKTVKRDAQLGRHESNHRERETVLTDLEWSAPGKPKRHEVKRVAQKFKVPERRVRKWVEQVRAAIAAPRVAAVPLDWRTIYHGRQLSAWYSKSARAPKKPKG